MRDPLKEFPKRVTKITLENGMRVLMVERKEAPVISFAMFIPTGGVDDDQGKTGLAHMFEHMLFKGTKTIGTKDYAREKKILDETDAAEARWQAEKDKGGAADPHTLQRLQERVNQLEADLQNVIVEEEYWQIYERAGAQNFNAGTASDFTYYTVSLPANQLPLWLRMEADRIANPVLREFYKERDVVMEERRMRVDNSPSGKLWENFLATAFMASPYGRPVVGWESDISRVTRADARRFFERHYDVSRLVAVIVGDFDTGALEPALHRQFGGIASHPTANERLTTEPPQEGERRVNVEYDAEPSLLIGYHRPNFLSPDNAALDVLSDVLSAGRTSRFHRNVVEKGIAASAWSESSDPGEREATLWVMGGTPQSPHTTADLETALYAQIEQVKKEGPTAWELEKVINTDESAVIHNLDSNDGLAFQLGYYEALAGDWKELLRQLDAIRRVTADEVKRVAKTYLDESNRTVAVIRRKTK